MESNEEKVEETIDFFKKLKTSGEWLAGVYGTLAVIISAIIGGYSGYVSILDSLAENNRKIEVTQMMMLNVIVRKAEQNPCKVSDTEWDEYIANYSTLYDLKVKYGKLNSHAPWKPIDRINTENDQCKNYSQL